MANRNYSHLIAHCTHARWFLMFGIVIVFLVVSTQAVVPTIKAVIPAKAGNHSDSRPNILSKVDPDLRGDDGLRRGEGLRRDSTDAKTIPKSHIPFLYTAAKRDILQAIPLRMADQITLNEDTAFNQSLVVMDKVIVIPKVLS